MATADMARPQIDPKPVTYSQGRRLVLDLVVTRVPRTPIVPILPKVSSINSPPFPPTDFLVESSLGRSINFDVIWYRYHRKTP